MNYALKTMPTTISGKNFKLTDQLKQCALEKTRKLQKFSLSPIKEIKIELDHDHNQKSGLVNRVEISVFIPGKIIKAGIKAEHMIEAIDLCLPKVIRQLKKFKSKQLKDSQPGQETFRK